MNPISPISKVTGAITHPLRTATSVAGGAIGVAAAGVRTATRIAGRVVQDGDAPEAADVTAESSPESSPDTTPQASSGTSPTLAVKDRSADTVTDHDAGAGADEPPAAKKAAPKKAAPKKAAPKKAAPKKAAAEKAATRKSPAKKTTAKKTTAKKTTAKKAPSAQAATAGPALAPDALAATDQPDDGDTSHVETEAEVVYSSATDTDSGPGETLTEPLIDPELAAALRSEVEASGSDPDTTNG